jgi:hypothetical protein
MTEDEKLDAECNQCRDPNCGLYGCMKRPPAQQKKLDAEFAAQDDRYFERLALMKD